MDLTQPYQVPTLNEEMTHAFAFKQYDDYTFYLAVIETEQLGSIVLRANDLVKLTAASADLSA